MEKQRRLELLKRLEEKEWRCDWKDKRGQCIKEAEYHCREDGLSNQYCYKHTKKFADNNNLILIR